MSLKSNFFKNKKGVGVGLFGFFFMITIFVAIYFFGTILMHYILYDYGIVTIKDTVAPALLQANGTAIANINALASSYLSNNAYFDILFLVLIVSAFIESTIAALKAKEEGFMSFFGYITIGNVFLIFIMFYGMQIQGWIFNEIIYSVLVGTVNTPIISFFINYGMYVGVTWYLWLITVNQINFEGVKDRISSVFGRERQTNRFDDEMLDNQLEELER